MKMNAARFCDKGLCFVIRTAAEDDAGELSELRLQIDGETEHLDREKGEAVLSESDVKQLIRRDAHAVRNLFLVAVANEQIVGFSRCEGTTLRRLSHQVAFGLCIRKAYWGHGIGKRLLQQSILWADANDIKKIALRVLETNHAAIKLYKQFAFEVEGVLKRDKRLSDGRYYDTIVMGRWKDG